MIFDMIWDIFCNSPINLRAVNLQTKVFTYLLMSDARPQVRGEHGCHIYINQTFSLSMSCSIIKIYFSTFILFFPLLTIEKAALLISRVFPKLEV